VVEVGIQLIVIGHRKVAEGHTFIDFQWVEAERCVLNVKGAELQAFCPLLFAALDLVLLAVRWDTEPWYLYDIVLEVARPGVRSVVQSDLIRCTGPVEIAIERRGVDHVPQVVCDVYKDGTRSVPVIVQIKLVCRANRVTLQTGPVDANVFFPLGDRIDLARVVMTVIVATAE